MPSKTITFFLAVLFGFVAPHHGEAASMPLTPGSTLYPAPSSSGPSGGTVLVTDTEAFSTPSFSGSLTSTVITGDLSNPLGGLTFTYLLNNDAGSSDALERFTVNDFANVMMNVSYSGPGTAPTLIDRQNAVTGDTVGFSWDGPPIGPSRLQPGTSSALLVLQTNATSYYTAGGFVIDGSVANVNSIAAVPESSTWQISLLACVGVAIFSIRRARSPGSADKPEASLLVQ